MSAQIHSSRKLRLRASLFLVFLSFSAKAQSRAQADLLQGPFYWQEKKAVYQSMLVERKIPVSVTHAQKDGHERWNFKAAGIVRAPVAFVFAETQKYEKLKTLSDHFQNVNWDPKTQILSLDIHFLARRRSMRIHIVPGEEENLLFRVEEGWFQGLEGVLMIRAPVGDPASALNLSEVAVVAEGAVILKWIPNFVFSLSAEAIMHHVAESLRTMTETDYKLIQKGE